MVQLATERPFGGAGRTGRRSPDPSAGPYYNFPGGDTWAPSVNLYETDNSYLVCVDLAGVEKEKIDIEVQHNELSLRGHRQVPWATQRPDGTNDGKLRVHVMEIDHGGFCRNVELPQDAAQERITATYRDGLLWIEIPKK